MKKIALFSVLAIFAISCSNNAKTEEQETKERDSAANVQKSKDEMYVDSLEKAEHHHDHDHGDSGHTHNH